MPCFSYPEPTEGPTERPCGDTSTVQNKEVIINGVDVSGCEFLCNRDYWCEQHKILVGTNKLQKADGLITCKDKTNCYYKQLQRKEQECERLKKEIKDSEQRALNRYINNNIQCVLPSKCIYVNRYKQAFDEIELIVGGNLCDDDNDFCPSDCTCDWKSILDIIDKAKEHGSN